MTKDTETPEPIIEPKADTKSDFSPNLEASPKPQIIRRGGIGLLTATFMSCIAALGGAYLSLFIQARPDIAQGLRIAPFLPKPTGERNIAEIAAIKAEIAAIQAHINAEGRELNPKIEEQSNIAAPNPAGANSPQNPNTANNVDNKNTQPALQNTTPAPAAIAAAQSAISLEPLRADMAGLSGRLTAIETRLAALDPTGTGGAIIAALQTEIATLKVTVEDLQTKISRTPSPSTTFAVISLAEAANRNGSFMPEFEAVRAALPFLPEVAALEPLARKGAPTRNLLAEKFTALMPIVSATDIKAKEEKGLVGWFRSLFAKMIKVKVNEETNPNAPSVVIARAKAKLDSGELAAAVDEARLIQNPPKELVDWINSANDRLLIESRISALRGAIERSMNPQAQQNLAAPTIAANAPPSPLPAPVAPVPAPIENQNIAGAKR